RAARAAAASGPTSTCKAFRDSWSATGSRSRTEPAAASFDVSVVLLPLQQRDEFAAAAHAGLRKDGLEVVLDGVRRHIKPRCDLRGREALADEPGHAALLLRDPVGRQQDRQHVGGRRRLDDYRDLTGRWVAEPGGVQDGPPPRVRAHAQTWRAMLRAFIPM